MTRSTALMVVRRIAIVLAFVVVLVRPGYGEPPKKTEVADVEVMVVIDRTRSMAALDWDKKAPRIEGVRADVSALIESQPGARFSLVTWGSDARLELPFTTDTNAVTDSVANLSLEDPYIGEGTKVDTPLDVMTEELERAEKQYPDRRRILVFMSDGEATAKGTQESFEAVGDSIKGGLVLGYGTEAGAQMPLAADFSDTDGFVEIKGKPALSKADPANLKKIAEETGAEYTARSEPGDMKELTSGFGGKYTTDAEVTTQNDLTWVAGLVLFVLLLWELHGAWRTAWSAPRALRGPKADGQGATS